MGVGALLSVFATSATAESPLEDSYWVGKPSEVLIFQPHDDCPTKLGYPSSSKACTQAFFQALLKIPEFPNQEDCEARFPQSNCTKTETLRDKFFSVFSASETYKPVYAAWGIEHGDGPIQNASFPLFAGPRRGVFLDANGNEFDFSFQKKIDKKGEKAFLYNHE